MNPMSYLLFKLTLEMAHIPTYNHEDRVKVLYQQYLSNFKDVGDHLPSAVVNFCKK